MRVSSFKFARPYSTGDYKSPKMQQKLDLYANKQPTPVTLRELYELGETVTDNTLLLFAQLLQQELPVRLAQRVRDIKRLPHGLAEVPSMVELRVLYEQSFARIMTSTRVRTHSQEDDFHNLLVDIKEQHASAQQNVALGLQEVMANNANVKNWDFSNFLDNFYMSRISLR